MQKLASKRSTAEALRLMNVQVTIDSVIQQLDRLERVSAHVNRGSGKPRSEIGDQNHIDTETNLGALEVKLLALQGILQVEHESAWTQECAFRITSWYEERKGLHSHIILQAVYDSLSACAGKFNPGVKTVDLTSAQLVECAGKLGQATEVFHEMQDEVKTDPEDYLGKGFANGKECDIDYSLNEVRKDMRSSKTYQTTASYGRPNNKDGGTVILIEEPAPKPNHRAPSVSFNPVEVIEADLKQHPILEKSGKSLEKNTKPKQGKENKSYSDNLSDCGCLGPMKCSPL